MTKTEVRDIAVLQTGSSSKTQAISKIQRTFNLKCFNQAAFKIAKHPDQQITISFQTCRIVIKKSVLSPQTIKRKSKCSERSSSESRPWANGRRSKRNNIREILIDDLNQNAPSSHLMTNLKMRQLRAMDLWPILSLSATVDQMMREISPQL